MDIEEKMRMRLDEYRKKFPDKAFRFIDTHPDVLRDRTTVDGYEVVKSDGKDSGTVGEVRVGDLVLACKPRKEADEERKRESEKSQNQINAPVDRFGAELERLGPNYLRAMTPGELDRDKNGWRRR